MNQITTIQKSEHKRVVEVWEASIRATHDFLKEEDLLYYKSLMLPVYLAAVKLRAYRNEQNEIIGFIGVADGNLEMLFLLPDSRRKGIGSYLLKHSIDEMNVTKVDVNEQNVHALQFYEKKGFEVITRYERDGTGKPYPILHMKLISKN